VRLLDAALPLYESPPLFDPNLANPALLPVNSATNVVLYYQNLYESSGAIGPWYDSFIALALHESPPLFDLYLANLAPFVSELCR
jgi:hypothetical protein